MVHHREQLRQWQHNLTGPGSRLARPMVSLWPRQPRRLDPQRHCSARASLNVIEALGTAVIGSSPDEADQSLQTLPLSLPLPVSQPNLFEQIGDPKGSVKKYSRVAKCLLPIAQDPPQPPAWCCRTGWIGGRPTEDQANRPTVASSLASSTGILRLRRPLLDRRCNKATMTAGEGRRQGSGSSVTRQPITDYSLRRSPPWACSGEIGEWHEHLTRPKPLLTNVVASRWWQPPVNFRTRPSVDGRSMRCRQCASCLATGTEPHRRGSD